MPAGKQFWNTVEEFFDENYDTGEHSVTMEEYYFQSTLEQRIAQRMEKRTERHARIAKREARLASLLAPSDIPVVKESGCIICGKKRVYGIWCRKHHPEDVRCIDLNSFGGPCDFRPTVNNLRCGHHIRKSISAQFQSENESLALPEPQVAARVAQATRPARTYSVKASQAFNGNPDDFFIIAGTGSRSLQTASTAGKQQIMDWLGVVLTATLENRPNLVVMSGMAEGFDKALAVKALELNIPLWCAIPNSTYGDYYWGRNSLTGRNMLAQFHDIMERATYVTTVMPSPRGSARYHGRYGSANFDRNDYMVRMANAFVVYDPSSAGTSHAFAAIRDSGKPYQVAPLVQ